VKAKICALCHSETRSGYYIDIMYITGVTTPLPGCDECRELLRAAKERIDNGKPVQDTHQKIRLSYLLGIAKKILDDSIYQRGST
jgi:hypothetical protein